jgi:AraC-like DNA-binding protein
VIVFTRGDAHVMSSSPGMRADPVPASVIAEVAKAPLPFAASYGRDGPNTAKLVCGFLACDARPFNPLLENLPPILVADSSEGGDMPWLGELIRLAISEASDRRAGCESVLGRLTELMLIEVIRRHLDQLADGNANWLSGLRDTFVGRALSLIHGDPGRPWTLAGLAKAVALSRSEFAERFARFVGLPPMQYLAKWRMQVAAGLLRDNVNIAAVAAEVGYGSEASFSRAFKKIVGDSPSHWRQRQTGSPAEARAA